ncbi:hypothetical protein Vi05172_g7022 [Venturia inaequalis]|nr:hypothetical protein Vi05172_g7022 [Venturia inaequalis]
MHSTSIILLFLAGSVAAMPQAPTGTTAPKSGGFMESLASAMGLDPTGDITSMVCESFSGKSMSGKAIGSMFGSPNGQGPDEQCMVDKSGGSGPYKAHYLADPTLPDHTIYVPESPPPGKLPVIVWGNGFCMKAGTMFANFLNEVASHGFMIIANGPDKGAQLSGQTTYKELIQSIDWVTTNPAAKKYGDIDVSKLAVAGQSCGGLEAVCSLLPPGKSQHQTDGDLIQYQASQDARVKMTALFNSGYIQGSTAKMMASFKNPVAWFLGGPKDIAQKNGDLDYKNLPDSTPAIKGTIEVGHIGTYYQKYGGKMGKAAVAFFGWKMKGDLEAKKLFCSPTPDSDLVKAGFKFEAKSGMC